AVDNTPARNESVLSPPASIALGDDAESAASEILSATPNPLAAEPPLPDDDACFIATAAYGGKDAADVAVLRAARDRFLLPYAAGRWLVRRYYAASPEAARFIERHPRLKPVVRTALKPFVLVARASLEGRFVALAVLAALPIAAVVAVFAVRRRARRSVLGHAVLACAGLAVLPFDAPLADPSGEPNAALTSSPRWMYEIKGGYAYPSLDDYSSTYGDD